MQLILRQLCHCHLVTCAGRSSRKTRLGEQRPGIHPERHKICPGTRDSQNLTQKHTKRTQGPTLENVQSDKRSFAYKKEHVVICWQITRSEPKSHELDRQLPKSTSHDLLMLSIFQRKPLFVCCRICHSGLASATPDNNNKCAGKLRSLTTAFRL